MRLDLLRDERLLISPRASGTAAPTRHGVLLFPQSYAIGMASLATHTLYAILNGFEGMSWERAFLDPARDSTRAPTVSSLESGTPLRDFDVIAITSSFELDWPALVAALEDGGVPPLRQTRGEVGGGPLVIVGGPAVSTAPLPLAAIYDAAYIGEIEPAAEALREALVAERREETLARLAEVPGFFVPEMYGIGLGEPSYTGTVQGSKKGPAVRGLTEPDLSPGMLARRCARNLDDFDTTSVILTPHSEFPDRFLVEIGRGCGRSCSFCLARRIYQPLRWRSLGRIMEAVGRGVCPQPYRGLTPAGSPPGSAPGTAGDRPLGLGLIAAAVSDYPDLPGLCAALSALPPDVGISTSSLRLETATTELLALLARGGQRTVTFAPEAATERLRHAIGKGLSDDDLFAAVDSAAAVGLTRLRLYFMVGLPTETADDREAIPVLARRLTDAFPHLSFRLNVGAFSPRPHTPFELEPLPPLRDLRSWLGTAQRSLKPLRRVEVTTESARWAAMQAALSRSDGRLGRALVDRRGQGYSDLVASLAAAGLVLEELIGRPDATGPLPWKIVDPRCVD